MNHFIHSVSMLSEAAKTGRIYAAYGNTKGTETERLVD